MLDWYPLDGRGGTSSGGGPHGNRHGGWHSGNWFHWHVWRNAECARCAEAKGLAHATSVQMCTWVPHYRSSGVSVSAYLRKRGLGGIHLRMPVVRRVIHLPAQSGLHTDSVYLDERLGSNQGAYGGDPFIPRPSHQRSACSPSPELGITDITPDVPGRGWRRLRRFGPSRQEAAYQAARR